MPNIIAFIIVVVILLIVSKLYQVFKERIHFVIQGLDSRFTLSEIKLLWNVAKICHLKDPNSLYFSLPALTKCMTQINSANVQNGTDQDPKNQALMSKLFNFRTKIQNDTDEKKGIDSTIELDKGQRLRIILPGKGVFVSEIVNNGSTITISMPKQKNLIPVPAEDWVNKTISVYLWRNGDAKYVFDTVVQAQGIFLGKLCLHLKHSSNLLRTQKRQAVRAKCSIHANLYIQKEDVINYNAVETTPGYRCLLEDISECGALIRIGGRGSPNMRLKLQYNINNKLILMFGIVRTVEYNEEINQTRLHFECIHIEPHMRNEVLAYVYNMLPESDREVYDAMKMTDSDANGGNEYEKAAQNILSEDPAAEKLANEPLEIKVNSDTSETVPENATLSGADENNETELPDFGSISGDGLEGEKLPDLDAFAEGMPV